MAASLFNRPHHQAIAKALKLLDADLFIQNKCFFGGGTAIALRYGEYRESVDIDFLVDMDGYRVLHQRIKAADSLNAIARESATITELREYQSIGYSIRSTISVDEIPINVDLHVKLTRDLH